MSFENAHKPIASTERFSAILSKPTAHESRASFRPAVTPGRRAVEAGFDRSDLAERDERRRRSGTRRRERQYVEQDP
jgi:hypothetical protein